MATIIQLHKKSNVTDGEGDISTRFKAILEKRRKGLTEPLTPEKLRKRSGLEHLTEEEALAAIDTIKKLASIFFETACYKDATCIENQDVVHLKQDNRAA